MYICHFCHSSTSVVFVGSKNEAKVHSCFTCFIETLKLFEFDGELIYYPLFGIRDIQMKDSVAYYDKEGNEIARVFLKSHEEGFLTFLKEELAQDTALSVVDILLVVEPHDVRLKE